MNHEKIYEKLIDRSRKENRVKSSDTYYENHHILPKCKGGQDLPENMVLLTAREHFLAHWLLVKMWRGDYQMVCAFNSFCMSCKKDEYISRKYEEARLLFIESRKVKNEEWSKQVSDTMKKKVWIKKDEECQRINRDDLVEYTTKGWVIGRIIKFRASPTEETRKKIGLGNTGKVASEETKRKRGLAVKDKVWIYRGKGHKMIHASQLSEHEKDGWSTGRNLDDVCEKNREKVIKVKNYKGETDEIKIKDFDKYYALGWQKDETAFPLRKLWVNKNGTNQRIKAENLETFIGDGWQRGRANFYKSEERHKQKEKI